MQQDQMLILLFTVENNREIKDTLKQMKSRMDIWDSKEKKKETKRYPHTECCSNLFSPYAEQENQARMPSDP